MKTNQPQKNNLAKWEVKKLSNLFTVKRGGSPRPIEHHITTKEDGLNWLKIGDIEVGAKYITSTSSKILKEGLKKTTLVKPGDFILSNSMSFGRPYISKIETCIHDGWLTFQKIDRNQIDQDFLYYLLLHPNTQNIFSSVSAGSGVQNLKKETVDDISLRFPPLPEQNRIVSVLETWDKAIEKLSKKIEVKKQIKKGLMQNLLTGKKRLKGFSDKWEIKKLGDISFIKKGDSITKKDITEGSVPVIAGGQQPAYYHNQSNRTGKTITVSASGAYAGYVNYYNQPIFVSDCTSIKEKDVDINFIHLYLKLKQQYIYSLQSGGAQPHVQPKDLQIIKIEFPKSKEEQTAIAKIFTTADNEIQELEKKLRIIKDQKKYLLNNLITGAIRTPEDMSSTK